MWPALAVVATLIFASFMQGEFVTAAQSSVTQGQANALATSLVIYGSYAVKYATANPTVQGSVSDAALGVPYWLVRSPQIGTYVSNGRGYAYYTGARVPSLAGQVAQATQMAMTVGTVTAGVLVVPQLGATPSIPIPGQIANGSVVVTN
ncbi:conserved exported hypothetical protein [Paraburkholderia tropica]|uniref:type IV pilus biogenesis protein PilM n=1 Tax=Paraburkholderia tropica TaxID=92647 RepID=UPI001CB2C32B|nr:type IV pilus biogenesis protein PilM [Paraburkholderia tropica]CAG9230066.1 conserved exported hypothetical protein [Paraburkholderia tropica]